MNEHLKFPIGKYHPPSEIDAAQIQRWIAEIGALPNLVRNIVLPLSKDDLDRTYRPDGWNIKQVVHHLGDSHLNSYVRFKWSLTEDSPIIKSYDEAAWAELEDYDSISDSIDFLTILHSRWTHLLRGMSESQWERTFTHPETGSIISLRKNVGLYAWHGKHHLAHIKLALGVTS